MSLYTLCVLVLGSTLPIYGAVCPDGYCRHSDGYYRTVALNVSWIDARSYCEIMGGALLATVSEAMATATEAALRRTKGTIHPGKFWLDITDLVNPKDFITMTDKRNLSYTDWSLTLNITEIPDTNNCVYMSEALGYQWMVTSCSEKMNFVCYKAGQPPTTERYVVGATRVYRWGGRYSDWVIEDVYGFRDISPLSEDC